MAFCGKCGQLIPEGASVCAACGAPVYAAPAPEAPQPPQPPVNEQQTPPPPPPPGAYAPPPGGPNQNQNPNANQGYANPGAAGYGAPAGGPQYGAPYQGAYPPPPPQTDFTAAFDPEDIARTKNLAALSYASLIFGIIGLLAEPDSRFLRFHINQSICLMIFIALSGLACVVPFLGWLAGAVGGVAALVFLIMGLVHTFKGRARQLPLVGKYRVLHWEKK